MRKKLSIFLCFILFIFIFTGCGNSNNNSKNNDSSLELNDELSNLFAFAINSRDELVARITGKEDLKILDNAENIKGFDYNYGKLYVYENNEIYAIDLTRGNGKYIKETIYQFTLNKKDYKTPLYAYNNKIFFINDLETLEMLDINTKEITDISSGSNITNFILDKENKILYYDLNALNLSFILYSYNIDTQEKVEIERFKKSDGYGIITLNDFSNGKLAYTYYKDYESKTAIYNISTKEKKLYDIYGGLFIGDDLYFVQDDAQDLNSQNYIRRITKDGKIEDCYGPKSDYISIMYIGNDELLYKITEGQDITAITTYYIYNIKTGESKETGIGYTLMNFIDNSDNIKPDQFIKEEIEFSKDDLVGEWTATSTSDSKYSIGTLFGTSLKYGNSLTFDSNGEYSLALGFSYGEKGKYKLDNDKIILYDISSEFDTFDRSEDELLIKEKDGEITLWHKEDLGEEYVYSVFEKKGSE